MSLDLDKLERSIELGNGIWQARCPACAESGGDSKGEHLRVYPDGRFGCCVFPGDREHRKRIFALAGKRERGAIRVRVPAVKAAGPVRCGILGVLEQAFAVPGCVAVGPGKPDGADGEGDVRRGSQEPDGSDEGAGIEGRIENPDGSDGVDQVESEGEKIRTLRTGERESVCSSLQKVRTLRTPPLYSLYIAGENREKEEVGGTQDIHKDFCRGVRWVRKIDFALTQPKAAPWAVRLPFFTAGGILVIPFDSPERYHWWKAGERLSLAETAAEARQREVDLCR